MSNQSQKKIILELFLTWLIVIGLATLLNFFSHISLVNQYQGLLTAILLLYVPLFIFYKRKEKILFLENSFLDVLKGVKLFFIFSLIVYPLVFLGNHFYQSFLSKTYHPAIYNWEWVEVFFFHLVMVALPEEFFFRGYFQERLNQIFGKPFKLWGANFGPGLFWCAAIFAASHSVISVAWWHAFIFFPALAFGWLKEKQQGLTAAILFHAISNLFSYWVFQSYH